MARWATRMPTRNRVTKVYPLYIVLAVIGVLEITISVLYPKLESPYERLPTLAVILLVPIAIVASFIYLWIRKPGHLYPPSEFSPADTPEMRTIMASVFHDISHWKRGNRMRSFFVPSTDPMKQTLGDPNKKTSNDKKAESDIMQSNHPL
jgi:hypothetical protein